MDNTINYLPILRSKRAEFDSLKQLIEADRRLISPLIEVVPPKMKEGEAFDALTFLTKLAHNIDESWYQYPLFIDMRRVGVVSPMPIGQMLIQLLLLLRNLARPMFPGLSVPIIPTIGLHDHNEYEQAVVRVATYEKGGICLRLTEDDLNSNRLQEGISNLLRRIGMGMEQIHLVIDYSYIDNANAFELEYICSKLPFVAQWKNVVIAAGSFPENLQSLEIGENPLPRYEWQAWYEQTTHSRQLPRFIGFGDYGIYHPIPIELPPEAAPSVSIRYASTGHWVVMRGYKARRDGPGYEQYKAHAVALRERDEYLCCGPSYSAGDALIARAAQEYVDDNISNPGNAKIWLAAGFNHHLTLTARSVAAARSARGGMEQAA
jgi:hypothetical protein